MKNLCILALVVVGVTLVSAPLHAIEPHVRLLPLGSNDCDDPPPPPPPGE